MSNQVSPTASNHQQIRIQTNQSNNRAHSMRTKAEINHSQQITHHQKQINFQQMQIQNPKIGQRRGESQQHPMQTQIYKNQQMQGHLMQQHSNNHHNHNASGVSTGGQSLITQVHKNQQPASDLSNEQKAQLQGYQKFGKEPLPPHLAACGVQKPWAIGKKTLILDLDETLVHSSFKPPPKPDIILPVEIEGNVCNVFVLIRPGTEFFLQRLSKCYELVIYTASLSKYADPLIDILDSKPQKIIDYRLFREHCTFFQGVFIKDMSLPGRPLQDSIIIDNSPTSYAFHQENAIPILSWYDDPKDRCLFELIPLLESLAEVDDVRKYIPKFVTTDHKVDFQRASYILSNATPKDLNKHRELKQVQEISDFENAQDEESIIEEIRSNNKKMQSRQKAPKTPIKQSNHNLLMDNSGRKSLLNSHTNPHIDQEEMGNVGQLVREDSGSVINNDDDKENGNHEKIAAPPQVLTNQWTSDENERKNITASTNKTNQGRKHRRDSSTPVIKSSSKESNQIEENNQMQQQQQQQQSFINYNNSQSQRPITRDNKRLASMNDEGTPNNLSSQNIKNVLNQSYSSKSRKINNQYFSRQSQLQQLLQTDQQQFKKSYNQPSMYNSAMTDGSLKIVNPSKTPNQKQGSLQLQRDNLSLSLQRQQQPGQMVNVQGMFSTPKANIQQNNSMFRLAPNGSVSNNNSNNNSEVNTFRAQRDISNKNLNRYNLQMQFQDQQNQKTFMNKQRRIKRNNEILNSTQPIMQISSSDIEINDVTTKHMKTPSRVQQNRQGGGIGGSLINKRRQNSQQKSIVGGNANNSFQRLAVGANINLNDSNFIHNSNIIINNISTPLAATNTSFNRPSSAKRGNPVLGNFSPKNSSQNQQSLLSSANIVKYGNITSINDLTQLSPYSPMNKNYGAMINGLSGGQMFVGQDFGQKRFLRNINRKSGAFTSNRHNKGNEM